MRDAVHGGDGRLLAMTIEHPDIYVYENLNLSQRAVWWGYELRQRWPLLPVKEAPERARVVINAVEYTVRELESLGFDGVRSSIPDKLADPEFIDCPQCGEITGHMPETLGAKFCELVTERAELQNITREQVEAMPDLDWVKIVMNPTLEDLALLVNDP